MKKKSDIAIIIQARLGSQRVPKKMLKGFHDTTLLDIALEKIKKIKSVSVDNFYLSAYEPEIVQRGKDHNLNIFYRSKESAESEGTPMTEMYDWWNKLPYKYCVLINACVPFLRVDTIDNFIEEYSSGDHRGQFAVMKKKNYFWKENGEILTPLTEDVMNTKTVQTTHEAAHCLYASRLDTIKDNVWMGDFNIPNDIKLFPIDESECLDVDYQWQFELCEALYREGGYR